MPSLQVRDLPEHIYRKLVDEAERQHRSLSQQAIAVLSKGLGMHEDPRERRRKVLERIRNNPIKINGKLDVDDIVAGIREDRER